MIRSISLLAVFVSLAVPTGADAMFVANYASWKKMPPALQEGYLIGVMDGWTRTSTRGEQPWMKAQRTGINKCMREQEISSAMLVNLVNSHYSAHTADWRVPPAIVVKDVIMGTCLADVNSEREKAGYSAWERQPTQISKDN
ncbi:hypothetical protein F4V91_08770 [Neorhizobium galegae]|uniref:DUF2799 domain-containing protein n=1 Tax=Neorhizobium galegae TaxID=399 RepID=A0A6A1TNV7_NEOGA|nr:hypothetical protein [Neorhizobium galegae]KAB1086511.1 hypothetical protein F4V91_08770 [Neorhizobium galegae]